MHIVSHPELGPTQLQLTYRQTGTAPDETRWQRFYRRLYHRALQLWANVIWQVNKWRR